MIEGFKCHRPSTELESTPISHFYPEADRLVWRAREVQGGAVSMGQCLSLTPGLELSPRSPCHEEQPEWPTCRSLCRTENKSV